MNSHVAPRKTYMAGYVIFRRHIIKYATNGYMTPGVPDPTSLHRPPLLIRYVA